MSNPSQPFIECEQLHAGLAVADIPAAVEFYTNKLGFVIDVKGDRSQFEERERR